MNNIAILASGSGSNAEAIMEHFKGSPVGRVVLLLSNNPQAYALDRAARFGVPALVFSRQEFADPGGPVMRALRQAQVDTVVLAGFLWLVPPHVVREWAGRIINIHPALLPKYGGKGMYGARVHEAVIAAGETESGITIHTIDEEYDKGVTLFQASVPVSPSDTPDTLAARIHELEHANFPQVIEEFLRAHPA